MNKLKSKNYFTILLGVLISIFSIAAFVYGATTIGTNIVTTGTASSTSATTTAYLYVGEDITEPGSWDFSGGDLITSGDAFFGAKASSTTSFAVGDGTINNIDMANGDLYVQGDAEIDGELYTTGSTTASIINMTTIKFTPSATPTSEVIGECFVSSDANADNQLKCYDGTSWQELW